MALNNLVNFPVLVFALSVIVLWLSASIGAHLRTRLRILEEGEREDFAVILAAALTLLGLIIGFSFSMAISRYDQRKNCEEAEANAIGTEYLRADLLRPEDAARMKALLRSYLEQRVLFYETRNQQQLRKINGYTARLQAELWSAVEGPAAAQPNPLIALAVSGMNEVLDSQGRTQAAWRNRIPLAAWGLMAVIAIYCNSLIGYSTRRVIKGQSILFLLLPIVLSISFFLIADIDSPRGGVILVIPQNLESLSQDLHAN